VINAENKSVLISIYCSGRVLRQNIPSRIQMRIKKRGRESGCGPALRRCSRGVPRGT